MGGLRLVTCIAGLPGSGKTFYAQALAKKLDILLIDDPNNWEHVKLVLLNYTKDHIIINDPYFCYDLVRISAEEKLNSLGYAVEWIFFENDPVQCQINASGRKNKKVTNSIIEFSKHYKIPIDTQPIPVYRLIK